MSDKPERVPHKDRPSVISQYCLCLWEHRENPTNPDAPIRSRLYVRNPDCPLHGDHVEESPF